MRQLFIALFFFALTSVASAETVTVKYRDTPVDLKHFECHDLVSSFVNHGCYDKKNQYLVLLLKTTRYHWCEVDEGTWKALLAADSKGGYFNANIKGKFDCRTRGVPIY